MGEGFSVHLAHVTGGRRYCFVVMSYQERFTFYQKIKQVVAEVTGFECIRADDLQLGGESLRQKIHNAIDHAVFVIADVSEDRPNIYYEVGYAVARNKPVLIVASEVATVHTDLVGVDITRYEDSRSGWNRFEQGLRQYLDIHRDSTIALLRSMILPLDPNPSFILLNPKPPRVDTHFPRHPRERRTYGDYLCLSGVMGVFISFYGDHCVPEIINAAHADDSFLDWDANLTLIGSPKVNRFTGHFLREMQKSKAPGWFFERCPGQDKVEDFEMRLVGNPPSGPFQSTCGEHTGAARAKPSEDFGLILRGPHPLHPGRMVLILAGPHSMGTAAAGIAATRPQLLEIIQQRLVGKAELSDKSRTLWVLTWGQADESGHIHAGGVEIVDLGVLD